MMVVSLLGLKIVMFIHLPFPLIVTCLIVAVTNKLTRACDVEEVNLQSVLEVLVIYKPALPSVLSLVFVERLFTHRSEI